jgi:methylmalonyl-CoA/ethylmalonyl-CoA epimerase
MTAVAGPFGLTRIGQIAVTIRNLPRAVAFYRDILGMRLLFEAPPAMAFFDCGGIRLMLSEPEGAKNEQFSSVIYYTVDDIQAATAELQGRGVTFEGPPHIIARLPHADLWMAFLRDPDGNMLALMSEVTR